MPMMYLCPVSWKHVLYGGLADMTLRFLLFVVGQLVLAASIFMFLLVAAPVHAVDKVPAAEANTYEAQCASCHGKDRLGGMGPALLPQNLARVRQPEAVKIISKGRVATQMPAFDDVLSTDQIEALVEYIYQEPETDPVWTEADILASRVVHVVEAPEAERAAQKPIYDADPLNVFLVVEGGDHHVTVLDGDTFKPIHRFKSRHALHGGPKYSSDGRYVYFASRDGWVSKFDMYTLETIVEVRAGINTRNLAVSADDRYVLVGNYLPHTLVLLNADDLSLHKIIPVVDDHGNSSRVSAVYTAEPRESFIVALKDFKEVWEISYSDNPDPVFQGYVHDYKMGEGLAEPSDFPIRLIKLDDFLDDFFFDDSYEHLIGASRKGELGQVINLDVGRRIADVDLPGMPHLGSGITWHYKDTTVLASPNLKEGVVSIIDTKTWKTVKRIETLGPGFFMRSHENSPYAWVDVFTGPDKDAVHVIDKQTLEIVKTLRPSPGKTSGHVEFTRDGRYALLSIWEMDGEVVVYDGDTLEEVTRIPASKPVGKYNVFNKITRSSGTSH